MQINNSERFLSLNGEIVPYSKANIPVDSVAMKYGASVFEGIRGYWDEDSNSMIIFALLRHLDRLFDSVKVMRMEFPYTIDEIIAWIQEVIIINNMREDCYIRCAASIIGIGGIDTTGPVLLTIDVFPKARTVNKGIKVAISSWTRISDNALPPRIKCIANYQNGRLATLQAKSDGYDNTILLNANGKISEAPTACIFFYKNGQLITPSVTSSILESVTRKEVILIAANLNIEVVEREIDRSECYLAQEAFLCGTGCEITSINSIDKYMIGGGVPGKITQEILHRYEKLVRGLEAVESHGSIVLQIQNTEHKVCLE